MQIVDLSQILIQQIQFSIKTSSLGLFLNVKDIPALLG